MSNVSIVHNKQQSSTLCLSLPGVPPRNAIRITIHGALEDMRKIQKDLVGSSGSSLQFEKNSPCSNN